MRSSDISLPLMGNLLFSFCKFIRTFFISYKFIKECLIQIFITVEGTKCSSVIFRRSMVSKAVKDHCKIYHKICCMKQWSYFLGRNKKLEIKKIIVRIDYYARRADQSLVPSRLHGILRRESLNSRGISLKNEGRKSPRHQKSQ